MLDPYDRVVALARRQDDMVTRRHARQLGMSDEAITVRRREHGWTAPIRGALFVPPVRDELRAHVRAALALAGGIACLLTAARLHGLPGLPPRRPGAPVDVAFADDTAYRRRRGCIRHHLAIPPAQVTDLRGIDTTAADRSIQDIVLYLDRAISVPLIDALLHAGASPTATPASGAGTSARGVVTPAGGVVTPAGGTGTPAAGRSPGPVLPPAIIASGFADLKEAVLRRNDAGDGAGGGPRFWALVDGRAESPLESRVRLALVEAGVAPEQLQWSARDPETGRLVGRLDLAWPSLRVAVEADGEAPHSELAALFHDRERQNALVRLGWDVLRFTWRDVVTDPARLVATVRDGLARASRSQRPT